MRSRSVKPAGDGLSSGTAVILAGTRPPGNLVRTHDGSGSRFPAVALAVSHARPASPLGTAIAAVLPRRADPAAIAVRMSPGIEVHERRPHADRPPGMAPGYADPALSPATRRCGALHGHPCALGRS